MPAAASAAPRRRPWRPQTPPSAFDSIFRRWVKIERTSASNVSTLRTAGRRRPVRDAHDRRVDARRRAKRARRQRQPRRRRARAAAEHADSTPHSPVPGAAARRSATSRCSISVASLMRRPSCASAEQAEQDRRRDVVGQVARDANRLAGARAAASACRPAGNRRRRRVTLRGHARGQRRRQVAVDFDGDQRATRGAPAPASARRAPARSRGTRRRAPGRSRRPPGPPSPTRGSAGRSALRALTRRPSRRSARHRRPRRLARLRAGADGSGAAQYRSSISSISSSLRPK